LPSTGRTWAGHGQDIDGHIDGHSDIYIYIYVYIYAYTRYTEYCSILVHCSPVSDSECQYIYIYIYIYVY
jgi:hypothetical protein